MIGRRRRRHAIRRRHRSRRDRTTEFVECSAGHAVRHGAGEKQMRLTNSDVGARLVERLKTDRRAARA